MPGFVRVFFSQRPHRLPLQMKSRKKEYGQKITEAFPGKGSKEKKRNTWKRAENFSRNNTGGG